MYLLENLAARGLDNLISPSARHCFRRLLIPAIRRR
jgi:hypothetical protein